MSAVSTAVAVYEFLQQYLNLEEFRTLCFRLSVDFDSLEGSAKSAKARELVLYMTRHGRLDELIAAIQQERPGVNLETFADTPDSAALKMDSTKLDRLSTDLTQLLAASFDPAAEKELQAAQQVLARETSDMILLLSQLDGNDYMAQTLGRFAQNPQKRRAVFQSTLLELMEESPLFSRVLADLASAAERDEVGKNVFKTSISGGEVGQVINIDKLEGGLNINSG